MGKLTLHSVYEQFQADILLNSLTESSASMPSASPLYINVDAIK